MLAIGGLKEKLLAALRSGIKTVLIPQENEKDLAEVPQSVKDGLEIVPISTVDEAIARALVSAPVAIEWVEPEEGVAAPAKVDEPDSDTVVTH